MKMKEQLDYYMKMQTDEGIEEKEEE